MTAIHNLPFRQRDVNAVAVVHKGASFTVGEILSTVQQYSKVILDFCDSLNGKPEDICIILPSANPVYYFAAFLACAITEVRFVPWRQRTMQLEKILPVVRPNGIFLFSAEHGLPTIQIKVLNNPVKKLEGFGNLVMLTSGSSGEPKGVLLDLEKVVLNNTSAGCVLTPHVCDIWSVDIDMALMSATCHMIMAWQFDLPFYHLENANDEALSGLFSNYKVGFGGSPIQLLKLISKLDNGVSPHMLVSSGDFLSGQMVRQLLDHFPSTIIHKLYGLTELGGRFCVLPHKQLLGFPDATGVPLPGFAMRLEEGVSPGEVSEVQAYSPCLADGYLLPDGSFLAFNTKWFSTGDLGITNESGVLTLVGRADDVIKVGGEKVDRMSIETALSGVLKDNEYCVLGVKHPILGQCLALFISSSENKKIPKWAVIVKELQSLIEGRFVPALMYDIAMPSLPRLENGKIDRSYLKNNHHHFERIQ